MLHVPPQNWSAQDIYDTSFKNYPRKLNLASKRFAGRYDAAKMIVAMPVWFRGTLGLWCARAYHVHTSYTVRRRASISLLLICQFHQTIKLHMPFTTKVIPLDACTWEYQNMLTYAFNLETCQDRLPSSSLTQSSVRTHVHSRPRSQ